MSIGICTMGSFSYIYPSDYGGSDGYSLFNETKRKPVVIIDKIIQEYNKKNISIEIIGVNYD